MDPAEAAAIRHLEEQLLRPDIRTSADQVAALLADDFVEFGSSGRIYNKTQMLEALQQEWGQKGPRTIADFAVRRLADDVALATYRVLESRTVRSSIWKRSGGCWRMEFHQGTKLDAR